MKRSNMDGEEKKNTMKGRRRKGEKNTQTGIKEERNQCIKESIEESLCQ